MPPCHTSLMSKMRFPFIFLMFVSCSQLKETSRDHIFVDVGSATGQSIDAFKTTKLYKKVPWEIYAIEPSKDVYNLIPKAPDVTLIPKAAWLYDGQMEFFKTTAAGKTRNSVYFKDSMNKEKVVWECMDFSRWLDRTSDKEDYVIVSMDIEGAEADILERMVKDGSIDLVDRINVEFSMEMITEPGTPSEDKQFRRIHALVENIRSRGILFDTDSTENAIKDRGTWIDEF